MIKPAKAVYSHFSRIAACRTLGKPRHHTDNPADGSAHAKGDGYTSREEFINETDPKERSK